MSEGIRRVVLVGLPGSGKSTVGCLLAQHLGWRFVDLDREIEGIAGLTVPEIFARLGESEFRRLERQLTRPAFTGERVVIAPGGGWITQPEARAAMADSFTVWLQVKPETALQRLAQTAVERPLLNVFEPVERMRELLREREEYYRLANLQVPTDEHSAEDVARGIMQQIRF